MNGMPAFLAVELHLFYNCRCSPCAVRWLLYGCPGWGRSCLTFVLGCMHAMRSCIKQLYCYTVADTATHDGSCQHT
jgi:hypothetical protein